MRFLAVVTLGALLAGCAIQRSQVAQEAKASMVGMTKEQVFTCMRPAPTKATEGATEIWSYPSGNGYQSSTVVAGTDGNFNAIRSGNTVSGNVNTFGAASGDSSPPLRGTVVAVDLDATARNDHWLRTGAPRLREGADR